MVIKDFLKKSIGIRLMLDFMREKFNLITLKRLKIKRSKLKQRKNNNPFVF